MNAIDSIIAVLTTPVARRNGVILSAEDSKVWAEEISATWEETRKRLKNAESELYDLKHKKL